MTIIRKVFSDSAFTAFRSVVSLARGIVLLPIITKLLGADSYGIWVTILAAVGLLGSAGGMHLHGSLIRYESQENKTNQTYSDVLFLTTIIGIFLASIVVIANSFIDLSTLFEENIASGFILSVVVALLLISEKLFLVNINFPRSKGHVRLYDVALIARNIFESLLLSAVFLFGGGILAGLIVLAGFLLVMNIITMAVIATKFNLPIPNPDNFKHYIQYGVPMIPKEISQSLLSNTDKYMIIYFLGPASVGIYAVAQSITQPLVTFTKIFDPTLYPTISKAWDEGNFREITGVYNGIFRFYSLFAIPAMVGLILLSDTLLTILSTPDIAAQAVYLVPIFLFGYFLKGYDNSIRYILTSSERTDIIGGSVMFVVIVNIVLNLLLIPSFDLLGAAIATFVSHTALFIIIFLYSSNQVRLKIPWRSIIRSVIGTIVMGISLLFMDLDIGNYIKIILYPAVGIMIYFGILLLLGEFSKGELCKIKSEFNSIIRD